MTNRCADLDEFFDGELASDQADQFRDHLADCERCQRVLLGRMQEDLAAQLQIGRAATGDRRVAAPPAPPPPAAVIDLAARRRRGLRRAAVYLAPLLAAAAAVPLWLGHRDEQGFVATVAIESTAVVQRGNAGSIPQIRVAHRGDVAQSKVRGERHQAIWVYLDERDLILACPKDGARCTAADGDLALQLTLTMRGRYAIVSLGSREPIPAAQPTLEAALVLARTTGVHQQVDYIDVK